MGYRVSAVTKAGGAVSVIVSDPAAVLTQVEDYRAEGFTEITVKNLDGRDVQIDELTILAKP